VGSAPGNGSARETRDTTQIALSAEDTFNASSRSSRALLAAVAHVGARRIEFQRQPVRRLPTPAPTRGQLGDDGATSGDRPRQPPRIHSHGRPLAATVGPVRVALAHNRIDNPSLEVIEDSIHRPGWLLLFVC